ncbi:MAG: TetR/AcrR family transcriptional regulator [Actinomycetota bacterium]
MPATPSARGARTRERLAAAALELFLTNGYDDVTTTDIADAAGVHPRTFFRHFATKADVVFLDNEATLQHLLRDLYGHDHRASPIEALTAVVLTQAPGSLPTDDDVARFHLANTTPSLADELLKRQRRFGEEIAAWLAQRTRRRPDDLEVRVAAACLNAARLVMMEEVVVRGNADPAEAEQLLRRALAIIDLDGW